MAAAPKIIWILSIIISSTAAQSLTTHTLGSGICPKMHLNTLHALKRLQNCMVILGNLQVMLERATSKDFVNLTFPNLIEVTGFVVIYRVMGLESVGQLFPNLVRIRGATLLSNYALIIYDMPDLKEIGLYSLLKIDRGGVIVWGCPQACFVDTIDWEMIAPRSRHVLTPQDKHEEGHCSMRCTCSRDISTNHCWSLRKCQRYIQGPEAEHCNDMCLGCRKTNGNNCSACKYYTYQGWCVKSCPPNSYKLEEAKHCISKKECNKLDQHWAWNFTCINKCPINYKRQNNSGTITCRPCIDCHKTCGSVMVQTLNTLQSLERCVYINGSLTIHLGALPGIMDELRAYLGQLQEVYDYIRIYASHTITSLDFLSSLRVIRGRNVFNGTYSFFIYDMGSLHSLFTPNVTKHLKVMNGTLKVYTNPMLCMDYIDEIKSLFPMAPSPTDIPLGMNGYSGSCTEVSLGLQARAVSETDAIILFTPSDDLLIHYTVLYVYVPPGVHFCILPEMCSSSEWYSQEVYPTFGHDIIVGLSNLRPASTYSVCIETYNPLNNHLARTKMVNFTTAIGKPEPPFIFELVASSSTVVVIHWVDHTDYRNYITHYELDVSVIDIHENDVLARNNCDDLENDIEELDYFRHAVVMKPPPAYEKGCESICGVLASVTEGAMVEDHFDICSGISNGCNMADEAEAPHNSSWRGYVKTINLNISGPRNNFQVGELAPFRDYRFRLRACTRNNCSRSTRSVVRTLPLLTADVPSNIHAEADTNGLVSVTWKEPPITNGPVLTYSVHILSSTDLFDFHQLPRVYCLMANESKLTVQLEKVDKYLVKVCSSSLASNNACSEGILVQVKEEVVATWWWSGIFFGILLCVVSSFIGYFWRKQRYHTDTVPLVDRNATYRNESEVPMTMLSDFMYTIPLRDSHFQ